MDLQRLLHSVGGLLNQETRHNDSVDTDGLLGKIGGLFRQNGYDGPEYRAEHTGGYNGQEVLPASMDPLGDPADAPGYSNTGYAQPGGQSEADRQAGILPASMDPLGDPADERRV
jgi:hypothetical protein